MSIDLSSNASSTLRQAHQSPQIDIRFALESEKKLKCEHSMKDFNNDDNLKNNPYYNTTCYHQDSFTNSSLNSKHSESMQSNKSSMSNKNSSISSTNQLSPKTYLSSRVESEPTLKSTSSKSSKNNFKLMFYKFLLDVIKFAIILAQMFQINFLQFIYFIRIQYEQKIHRYFDKSSGGDDRDNLSNLVAPTHVCVVLNQNVKDHDCVFDKLALVTEFFATRGVKYLSFYKFEGVPLEVKERLTHEYNDTDLNNNSNSSKSDSSKKENLKNRFELNSANNFADEIISKKKLNVKLNFLSYANGGGKDIIVKTCRKISNRINQDQLKLSDLNQDFIDTQILESTDLVEPELIINIGNHDTVVGFSPWHIRLSEIM